jgi:hypothetical protein
VPPAAIADVLATNNARALTIFLIFMFLPFYDVKIFARMRHRQKSLSFMT